MEVKLTIDSSQLGDTVVDLFKNISDEKKEELALQIMREWLKDPIHVERQTAEASVFPQLRIINDDEWFDSSRVKYSDMTDDQLRRSRRYKDSMASFKSSKEEMVKQAMDQAIAVYRKNAADLIQNDTELKAIFETVSEEIKNDFPKFIHDAMMYWFSGQLQTALQTSSSALARSANAENIIKTIQQKINVY